MVFIIKRLKILFLLIIIVIIPTIIIIMADNYYSDRTTMYIGKQIEMSSTRMFQSVVHQNVLNNVDINSLVNINYNTDSNLQI